jgi:hypothetical protein
LASDKGLELIKGELSDYSFFCVVCLLLERLLQSEILDLSLLSEAERGRTTDISSSFSPPMHLRKLSSRVFGGNKKLLKQFKQRA